MKEFKILERFAGQYGNIFTAVVMYVCAETVVSIVHNRLYFNKEHVIPTRGVHPTTQNVQSYWIHMWTLRLTFILSLSAVYIW